MDNMLHYEIKGNCLIVYIKDELDHHAVTYLRETSDRLIEAGNVKNIIFDFKDVNFMDSSGIGLVMGRWKLMRDISGRVVIENAPKAIKKVMKMSGIEKLVSMEDKKEGSFV